MLFGSIGYAITVNTIKCSVLMCVYGGDDPAAVAASLESLVSQSRPPDEIVLVEDGPLPQELVCVIEGVTSSRPGLLKILRLETNKGLIASLNEGLKQCRGEFLFRMDADDVCRKDRIQKQLDFMEEHPRVGVLGSAMEEFVDDPGHPVRFKPVKQSHDEIRRQLAWRNPVNHPTVCIRRDHLGAARYPDLVFLEDYFLWVTLMAQGTRFHNLPDALLCYRFDDRTLRRRGGWRNFRNEVYLRWWMYRHRLIHLPTLIASVVLQAVLRFSPLPVQRRIWGSVRPRIEA